MDDMLTSSDASKILGVVPATVRLLADAGKLPALRTAGGMRLFRRADVERVAAQREARRAALASAAHAGSENREVVG